MLQLVILVGAFLFGEYMNNAFDIAFENVLQYEGGFTNDPKDRGNWTTGVIGKGLCKGTKYGISTMAYPSLNIRDLTVNQAKDIYYKDYWLKNKLDKLEPVLAFQLFDACIQHGSGTAIKLLQKLLGITTSGSLDEVTLSTLKYENQKILAYRYIAKRLEYYTSIKTFSTYGKGWVNRMALNLNITATNFESTSL